jgi:hypothetical protein
LAYSCCQTFIADISNSATSSCSNMALGTVPSNNSPMKVPNIDSGCHHNEESPILAQHRKALIAAVACEANQPRRWLVRLATSCGSRYYRRRRDRKTRGSAHGGLPLSLENRATFKPSFTGGRPLAPAVPLDRVQINDCSLPVSGGSTVAVQQQCPVIRDDQAD